MNRDQIEKAIKAAQSEQAGIIAELAEGEIGTVEFNCRFGNSQAAINQLKEMLPTKPVPQPEPAKPRFAVGQRVRIIGPSVGGTTDRIGQETSVTFTGFSVAVHPHTVTAPELYPTSSLALASEVPAPKFKRGDKVQKNPNAPRLTVDQITWTGSQWVYTHFHSKVEHVTVAERFLSPAEPVYLPTRWIHVERTKDYRGNYDCGFVRDEYKPEIRRDRDTHILHDMPRGENGVQVDFVTLTNNRYCVVIDSGGEFIVLLNGCRILKSYPTAIDAWRAAGRHSLDNKK